MIRIYITVNCHVRWFDIWWSVGTIYLPLTVCSEPTAVGRSCQLCHIDICWPITTLCLPLTVYCWSDAVGGSCHVCRINIL